MNVFREPPPIDGLMKQFALGEFDYTGCGMKPIEFKLEFEVKSLFFSKKKFHVYYKVPSIANLDITVSQDCIMEIRLSDDKWRWSTQYQAITTKKCHADIYKGLIYVNNSGSYSWKHGMNGSYKTIRFYAVKRREPSEGHGFCFNVEFKVLGSNLWLPVVIDPDIINPRPNSLFAKYFNNKNWFGRKVRVPLFALSEEFKFIPMENTDGANSIQ